MSLNRTVTKKILETIVHETFSNFGLFSSSALLDSLKLLGFYYATNAGISINIEDLKTPDSKKNYIETANKEIDEISQAWAEGIVSDQERFQSIIDSWNIATESLKNKIVEYYQNYDPSNNLYIMAFSGARGNMSQVRQLVGMRGLMSDQEGNIIDLPIQANFREGLSSIDYIISSYGARKGIVDTALKTADSGYLTRRLIYLAQDLVIREIDCKTTKGISVIFQKHHSIKNLIGRNLLEIQKTQFPYEIIAKSELWVNNEKKKGQSEDLLTSEKLNLLKGMSPLLLRIRSPLTCESKGSICQKCYGWDLAQQKLISLGETIGIIAAQSIGEPGTQLTMRTFHTGGIFTGENLKQIKAPFSGKLLIPDSLKTVFYRTNHGVNVLKLQQESKIQLVNWKGMETTLFLEIGSYLYVTQNEFVYKGQLIAEFLNQSVISGQRKAKPIYTPISGKVLLGETPVFPKKKKGKLRRVVVAESLLLIAGGKIIRLPNEFEALFDFSFGSKKPMGRLKIITPKRGLVSFINQKFELITETEKLTLDFSALQSKFQNCSIQFTSLVKNYHYVDSHTVIGYIYVFSTIQEKSYYIETHISQEPEKRKENSLFVITDKETWQIYGPSSNSNWHSYQCLDLKKTGKENLSSFWEKRKENHVSPLKKIQGMKLESLTLNEERSPMIIRPSFFDHPILQLKHSGLEFVNEVYFSMFQYLQPICLPRGTILNAIENALIEQKSVCAILVHYIQQTDDIVQGLPKIEELVEARKPKLPCILAAKPGVFFNNTSLQQLKIEKVHEGGKIVRKDSSLFRCRIKSGVFKKPRKLPVNEEEDEKEEKQIAIFAHAYHFGKNILREKNRYFRCHYIPKIKVTHKKSDAKLDEKEKKLIGLDYFKDPTKFQVENKDKLWSRAEISSSLLQAINLFRRNKGNYKNQGDLKPEQFSKFSFYESKNQKAYLIQINRRATLHLELINAPLIKYVLPHSAKLMLEPGEFVDIGEPITDGMIDSHELLKILFTYHLALDGILLGTMRSLNKFRLILMHSIQSIYQGQGVTISSKHIEIIVSQMTSKVLIRTGGQTPFLSGELVSLSLMLEIYLLFSKHKKYQVPNFEPKLLSATNSSLNKDGFLSAAGFQETRKILTKAAIEGNSDWLRGLKESLMSGRMIPAGSAFLNYKNYLDNFYFIKK